MTQDDLIDVGLGEFLGLDLVFLRSAQQIIEEGHIELEHFDELHQTAIGNVQFTIEVKAARVAVGAVLGNLAIINVACKLGGILVLLVFGLKGADADAVLLGEHQAIDFELLQHAIPVAVVFRQPFVEHLPAEGA